MAKCCIFTSQLSNSGYTERTACSLIRKILAPLLGGGVVREKGGEEVVVVVVVTDWTLCLQAHLVDESSGKILRRRLKKGVGWEGEKVGDGVIASES